MRIVSATDREWRKHTELYCDDCGTDIAKTYSPDANNHKSNAYLEWWTHERDSKSTVFRVRLTCDCKCRLGREFNGSLWDGPLTWFAGLRAFREYVRITRDYTWEAQPLERLQQILLNAQGLPTWEGEDILL